jgi:MFS family permease
LHKIVAKPLAVAAPLHHHVRRAVKEQRLGNFHADHGLDVLTFFLADVQTGFGPFIAVYLTANHWTAAQVGAALSVGTVVTMAAQVPAGAAIDAISAKRLATVVGLLALLGSAVLLALLPHRVPVIGAEVLHGIASCMLVPAVAAVTLSRVGRSEFAHRLGRNTRFMALGNGIGAGLMGFAGAHLAASAPFWLTALSVVPAMLALWALPPHHKTQPPAPRIGARKATAEGCRVLCDHRLLLFTLCVVLFQGANAFILPLAMGRLTNSIGGADSNVVLAGCLIVSQTMVALISPFMGRKADAWGRRPVLLIGFAAVPLHAALLAVSGGAYWIIALQILDGMGGAMFGVLQPLIAADVTHGTNRFNLTIGVLGLAGGLGATLSGVVGGGIATEFGYTSGFLVLAATGVAAVLAVALLMPETREHDKARHSVSHPQKSHSKN